MIWLKGKEEAQPSQDNRDNMVKKLEKGSNLAPSKTQQKNHNSSNVKATKSNKHRKILCYGCELYGHEWVMCPQSWVDKVESAEQKASTKMANQVKSDEPSACLTCNKLGYLTKNCLLYKEARKKAQITSRRCYGCNETGHMINRCLNKQNKHRANEGRICYACRRKGLKGPNMAREG